MWQRETDFAVINYDYPESKKLESVGKSKKYFFSAKRELEDGAFVDEKGDVFLTIAGREKICSKDEIKLIGRHNLENIASAVIVGKLLGVDLGDISSAVKNFVGLPHRLELVKEINGIKFYNDSFSTNPTPTIAAIKSFLDPITLILGGSEKKADFSELSAEIKKSSIRTVITIGAEGPRIAKSIRDLELDVEIIESEGNIDGIVSVAFEKTKPGGVVLFSPACASFDMFKNYKDRGEKFKIAVSKL
jgi:UDP-N-acetylmuramoylalanine--D-glutamate ligase